MRRHLIPTSAARTMRYVRWCDVRRARENPWICGLLHRCLFDSRLKGFRHTLQFIFCPKAGCFFGFADLLVIVNFTIRTKSMIIKRNCNVQRKVVAKQPLTHVQIIFHTMFSTQTGWICWEQINGNSHADNTSNLLTAVGTTAIYCVHNCLIYATQYTCMMLRMIIGCQNDCRASYKWKIDLFASCLAEQ